MHFTQGGSKLSVQNLNREHALGDWDHCCNERWRKDYTATKNRGKDSEVRKQGQ